MRTRHLFAYLTLLLSLLLPCNVKALEDPWVKMPQGARPTFMGIHGGTMPVSLLVSDDGESLLTFVGRTGNDFLEILHRTEFQLPSLLKKTAQNATRPSKSQTVLHAGDTNVNMPVLVITDLGYLQKTLAPQALMPFGFSEKPVKIEGRAQFPKALPKTKRYRLFFQPNYLQPR